MTAILNKKVLLAASVIVAVAAIALGATYAAWQASDNIDGNTVSTATLSITAEGVQGGAESTYEKPVFEEEVLPGFINFQADNSDQIARGIVTNDSSVALDLYMYFELTGGNPGACEATQIAWQSSQPNSVNVLGGYAIGAEPNAATTIAAADAASTNGGLSTVTNYAGIANAVKIADDSYFAPDAEVAVRQIAAFATDADYPDHSGSCTWNEVFVGTLPDVAPAI